MRTERVVEKHVWIRGVGLDTLQHVRRDFARG